MQKQSRIILLAEVHEQEQKIIIIISAGRQGQIVRRHHHQQQQKQKLRHQGKHQNKEARVERDDTSLLDTDVSDDLSDSNESITRDNDHGKTNNDNTGGDGNNIIRSVLLKEVVALSTSTAITTTA